MKREDVAMPRQHHIWPSLCAAAVLALTGFNLAQSAPLMIVGNDEKPPTAASTP
jgi:hypothetical protein